MSVARGKEIEEGPIGQLEDNMKTNIFKTKLMGASLTLIAMFGLMAATGSAANAQSRDREDRYDRTNNWQWNQRGDWQRRRNEIIRVAQQNGYRDGLSEGRSDRFSHRRYNFSDSIQFRNAMSGYRWEFGDRELYRSTYRDAFRRGYEEAYQRGGYWRRPF